MKKESGSRKKSDRREGRLAEELGGKRVRGSGSGRFNKEDISFIHALLQDKSTGQQSLSIHKKDLITLEGNALLSGKVPIFSFGFTCPTAPDYEWIAFPVWWLKDQLWWKGLKEQ